MFVTAAAVVTINTIVVMVAAALGGTAGAARLMATEAVVVVAVGVVVGFAMRNVRDMASCDVGVVAAAAETLPVSLCAVEA